MRTAIFTLSLLLLTACTAAMHAHESAAQNCAVDIPAGWRQIPTKRYFMLTREGPFYQYALVQQRPVDKPFQHTKKRLKSDMLPQEAAEVLADEMLSDQNLRNIQIIENTPAKVNGSEAFKLVLTYADPEGRTYKTVYYGFLQGDFLYSLRFTAAGNEYFERDLGTFEAMLHSFRIVQQ
jgi:hypothetical protein